MAELAEQLLNEEHLGRSRVRAVLRVSKLKYNYIFCSIARKINALDLLTR